MKPFKKLSLFSGTLVVLLLIASGVSAATKNSRSPTSFRTFWNCSSNGASLGLCAPYMYAYSGYVIVNYTSKYDSRQRSNVFTITGVDQSVSMSGAGRFGNPCSVGLGISVDVFDKGRYITTLYGTSWGSYIYSPNDLLYGKTSKPNLTLTSPTFSGKAVASSWRCFNLPSTLTWSFGL